MFEDRLFRQLVALFVIVPTVLLGYVGVRAQTDRSTAIALPTMAKTSQLTAPSDPPGLTLYARVSMPYACLAGDTPDAEQDANGYWLINCFRINSSENGAAPVYWRDGMVRAEPMATNPAAELAAQPRAVVSDCRGTFERSNDNTIYYFAWYCGANGRYPSLIIYRQAGT